MRFNVSRFLVRVRQFWTRERLVPVLGFTALALFLLNFWAFLGHQFNAVPLTAAHMWGGNLFADSHSHVHNRHFSRHQHRHSRTYYYNSDHESKRKRCRKKKRNDHQTYYLDFQAKRFEEEAERFQEKAERFRAEIEQAQETNHERVLEMLDKEFESRDKHVRITRDEHGNKHVTIRIDGEVIEVP